MLDLALTLQQITRKSFGWFFAFQFCNRKEKVRGYMNVSASRCMATGRPPQMIYRTFWPPGWHWPSKIYEQALSVLRKYANDAFPSLISFLYCHWHSPPSIPFHLSRFWSVCNSVASRSPAPVAEAWTHPNSVSTSWGGNWGGRVSEDPIQTG